jgi:hypothetical protein
MKLLFTLVQLVMMVLFFVQSGVEAAIGCKTHEYCKRICGKESARCQKLNDNSGKYCRKTKNGLLC